uniref:Uncharacterized protein n=1 Tax=Ciona savignyi TaxID=51511 RepID=H2ZEI7_CIOSA
MLGLLRKRRHARMMFPAAPAMRTMHEQVTGLLPGPGKSRRNSFPLCGKQGVTFSVEPLPGLYQAHRRLYKELDTQAASSCKKMKQAYDSTLNVLEILFNSTKQQESLNFKATHFFWRMDVIQRPNRSDS